MASFNGEAPSFLSGASVNSHYQNKQVVVNGKNLYGSEYTPIENYKVFLRIKPPSHQNTTHIVVDSETILTEVPKESVSYKVLSRKNNPQVKRRFKFTSILNEASQKETFDTCVLPSLKSFLQGEDCLLMAFGTTSAGKTFTMQGTADHPGMIPRAISYIFRSLDGALENCDRIQPHRGTQLLELTESMYRREVSFKNIILGLNLAKYQKKMDSSYMSFKSFNEDEAFHSVEFKNMEERIEANETFPDCISDRFSVWVSMIEIYNENIVDLLQLHNGKVDGQFLNLGVDDRGGFFAKNVTYVPVRNGHEAYQINQFGRTNLHRAATALNDKSSRSHSIFTVTLVRHQAEGLSLHRFSFVDLAGSERVKKTLNDGNRLVESNCINKSLSVLGKCLHAMKENQNSTNQQVVPVRDSKITKLFKNALVGVEKLSFIINITTDPNLFDETLHVLKFSALVQEIVPDNRNIRSNTRFSRIFHANKRLEPSFSWSAASSVSDLSEKPNEISRNQLAVAENRYRVAEQREEDLLIEIADLKSELKETKEAASTLSELLTKRNEEIQIMRAKVFKNFEEAMNDRKKYHGEEIEKLKQAMQKENQHKVDDLTKQIDHLKNKIRRLRKEYSEPMDVINELKEENQRLQEKLIDRNRLLDDAFSDYAVKFDEGEKLKSENVRLMMVNEKLCEDLADLQSLSEEEKENNAQITVPEQNVGIVTQKIKDKNKDFEVESAQFELLKLQKEIEILTAAIKEKEINEQEFKSVMIETEKKLKDTVVEQQVMIESQRMLLQQKNITESEEMVEFSDQQEKIKELTVLLEKQTSMENELKHRLINSEEKLIEQQAIIDELTTSSAEIKKRLEEEEEKAELNRQIEKNEELAVLLEKYKLNESELNFRLIKSEEKLIKQQAVIEELTVEIKKRLEETCEIERILRQKMSEQKEKILKLTEELNLKLSTENETSEKLKESCEVEKNLRQQLNEKQSEINLLQEWKEKNIVDQNKLVDNNHEKELLEELEMENQCLKKSVKESCSKEMRLREENETLKAAINALEQEAVRSNFKDVEKLTEQIKQLELKYQREEGSITNLKDQLKQLNDQKMAQEIEFNHAKKLQELELQSALKKLETSEYQRKVYLAMKEKADEEAKIIPNLKELIERLENELLNKNQELEAFESKRNFLLSKYEREIKQYQEEINRLKKDVQFGHAVVIENLKNSEKKDEIKRLQDELHSKNIKLLLMEKKSNERSPLTNFTNFVPTGNLVDISPYTVRRLSRSCENIRSNEAFSNNLPISGSMEYLAKIDGELKTPIKTYLSDKENINSSLVRTGEKYKKLEASSMESLSAINSEVPSIKVNFEDKVSPGPSNKSVRKTRTAKKRDPRDHPALSKSAKKSNGSIGSPMTLPKSAKKQLFSNNDFVELSDDSDFLPPPSPHQAKRNLRPRTKRRGLEF